MIGLIGAMAVEMEALSAQMTEKKTVIIGMDTFMSGRLFGVETVLAICGPGKVNAAICTQSMITNYSPDWVLNLGVAGAGDTGVKIGDMVVATACVQHDVDTSAVGDPVGLISKINLIELPCDDVLRARLVKAAEVLSDAKAYEGIVATGDQFIHRAEDKTRIHQLFGAKAVEMEGGAVAQVCHAFGVPCGVLRSISDQADGQAELDYPSFVKLAADHSQQVVKQLLTELLS